jgi:hypothetical protein
MKKVCIYIIYITYRMDTIRLRLTTSQLRNLQKGRSFQLSHPQLSGQSKGEHEIEIPLPSHHTQKLMKNMSMGKGFRFPASSASLDDVEEKEMQGGATYLQRLARRTRNTFRPVARAFRPLVKPALKELKDIALPIVKDAARDMVRDAVTGAVTGGVGGNLLGGAPKPLYTKKTTDRIMTHGLSKKMVNQNGLMHGGSFLPLG